MVNILEDDLNGSRTEFQKAIEEKIMHWKLRKSDKILELEVKTQSKQDTVKNLEVRGGPTGGSGGPRRTLSQAHQDPPSPVSLFTMFNAGVGDLFSSAMS